MPFTGISQPNERKVLKEIYGNCISETNKGKTRYFAKYIPTVRRDGRGRPCSEEADSLEYTVYSIEKMLQEDKTYWVVFLKSHEIGAGYCNNRWFDAAIYILSKNTKSTGNDSIYSLVNFQPFIFETNRGEADVRVIKLGDKEFGFQFTGSFHQMGSSSYGAIYFAGPLGLNRKLYYDLYSSHACRMSDVWLKTYKYEIKTIKRVDASEYYDIEVNSLHEEYDKAYEGCGLYYIHERYSYGENGYESISKQFEYLTSFKK